MPPSLLQSSRFAVEHVVKSFLMIAARHPVSGRWEPILVPGWTLNYEMFFYVIFALCLWLTRRSLNAMTAVVCTAMILIHACSAFVEPTGVAGFYTDGIILEFVFGILVCRGFLAGARIPAWLCPPLIVAGIAGFALSGEMTGIPRQYAWGLPVGREPIFILTSTVICIAAAILIYRFIEMPMTDWLKARFPLSSLTRREPRASHQAGTTKS